MLLQQIKELQVQARKNKDSIAATLLTTLLGEAISVGKNAGNRDTNDGEVQAIVKKFIKNIDEVLSVLKIDDSRFEVLLHEKQILEQFLPRQLSDEELTLHLTRMAADSGPKLGVLMQMLKQEFAGQYDGQKASAIAKSLLG